MLRGHSSSYGNSILYLTSQNTLAKTPVPHFPITNEVGTDTFMLETINRNTYTPLSWPHTPINSRFTTICKSQDGVVFRVRNKFAGTKEYILKICKKSKPNMKWMLINPADIASRSINKWHLWLFLFKFEFHFVLRIDMCGVITPICTYMINTTKQSSYQIVPCWEKKSERLLLIFSTQNQRVTIAKKYIGRNKITKFERHQEKKIINSEFFLQFFSAPNRKNN